MKRMFIWAVALMAVAGTLTLRADEPKGELYLTVDQLPDWQECLPAPPDAMSADFTRDIARYMWGRVQRFDSVRAAMAWRDASWSIDSLIAEFEEPFGMKISPVTTPAIYRVLVNGVLTIEQSRVKPKKFYARRRPFEVMNQPMFTRYEEEYLRGEGSYPSGHTVRGWSVALLLTQINPAAAEALFRRAWLYGESRVIVGAHWQSDVDVSRAATSLNFACLQSSPLFQAHMAQAQDEFRASATR